MTGFSLAEAFTASKEPSRPNEDAYLVGTHLVAVIDGVTDKTGHTLAWRGETVSTGRFAAQVVREALVDLDRRGDPLGAHQAVAHLARRLDDELAAQGADRSPRGRPGCAVAVWSARRHQVWGVGDCSWAFGGVVHQRTLAIDQVTSEIRREVVQAHLDDGETVSALRESDPGRRAVAGVLAAQAMFANRDHRWGYGVVNGTAVPDRLVDVVDLGGPGRLVLTTDGYPEIGESREASDRRLAELVETDPLCIGPLLGLAAASTTHGLYDDRTWVSVDVT